MTEMIKNPPLYEVAGPDGPVTQKWRGMPKLPDLIETMLSLRTKKSHEAYRQREDKQRVEQRELEQRRDAHPEEFFGWADVLEAIKEKLPEIEISTGRDGIQAPVICEILGPEPVSLVLMSAEAASRRVQQMKADFEKHQQKKAAK